MRILVLGGTWFLGRFLVEEALRRGHTVTTFNRGRVDPGAEGVESRHGDRANPADLEALVAGREWDTVVDTSGMIPRLVSLSARRLDGHVARYVFVSTVNVYRGWPTEPLTEASPVRECDPGAGDEDLGESVTDRQGRLKSGCERAVGEVFGDRSAILRPGVILGPHEYVGRLPWWLTRIAKGGRVLAPGYPERPFQAVDVRDVAAFALHAAERALGGAFNVCPPIGQETYGGLLTGCVRASGSPADLTWVDDAFLLARQVGMWRELPLWRVHPGAWQVCAAGARAAGLRTRPLWETVVDTWRWMSSGGIPVAHQRRDLIGIDPAKEQRILREWLSEAGRSGRGA
ncbi:NAD-dependent epimerase/dehydratase family protein [Rhizohabitans arisaemae]|uniref:NAD-dependent epimerase/dehydratase family protein n=1 Tax=Rhizohabitans arisaemae TaxID=2720610 RepID=UPI0024B27F35|nr:NAD-dependent epimerase/dehydratase family protein [Rhizohabitans arisaemae]